MERKGNQNSQTTLEKRTKVEDSRYPNFKTCCKATVLKTLWCW